jgi:hypothetical protein
MLRFLGAVLGCSLVTPLGWLWSGEIFPQEHVAGLEAQ